MLRRHLRWHGQTYLTHLRNNCWFTFVALKAAAYTLGHGLTPRISGRRASQLHNELWDRGRLLSISDITHRLSTGLYADRAAALADLDDHRSIYDEQPRLASLVSVIDEHFGTPPAAGR